MPSKIGIYSFSTHITIISDSDVTNYGDNAHSFYPYICAIKQRGMNGINDIRKEILCRTQRLLHYNELLVKQCDSWLSEEEGMKNMEQRIRERGREQKRKWWKKVNHQKSTNIL